MPDNLNPCNEQGKRHGYWEICGARRYLQNNKFSREVIHKGHYVNGFDYGFWIERKDNKIYYAR